ncbi:uncharacterized protein LOC116845507 [Odontomachus brunneus]|uniref:uncharacterized protein LOC116845507 n=1 Tax=Odontomachus brunneus TaxID=486640 RepID=UPI0013F1B696|nr:uncharacterized protein LOC116845507 [Odontomachus brunneus]XP_032674181.1 uncharacterized protein LOC116845507 [Odontomachus brunneus]
MHGIRRILVFCTMIVILPVTLLIIPLYLRHSLYADVAYAVTESDIMEINDGVSSIFCSEHTIQMNGTFNAFQMTQRPEVTSYRKHIRLKKSMSLPDDTLEYWGFYLLKGATVVLSVCSRFEGASILVVKGERNLQTCDLLQHNNEKEQTFFMPGANKQVKIIYESNAQEIDSSEIFETVQMHNNNNTQSHANVNSKDLLERDFEVSTTDNIKNTKTHPNSIASESESKGEIWYNKATLYIHKYKNSSRTAAVINTREARYATNRQRNTKKNRRKRITNDKKNIQNRSRKMRVKKLKQILYSYSFSEKDMNKRVTEMESSRLNIERIKRSRELIEPSLLDQGIRHGGNADKNMSESNEASSLSSFEYDLFNCYGGSILLAHEFDPSSQCTNISYLIGGKHTQTSHHVEDNGYYYYIFYSDNDIVSNDIYALFDIYKPTFQYENITKSCINQTECSFSLNMLSSARVIVEIPTRDGIEHSEMDDVSMLISTCHPRMGAYVIFPIAIMFLILGCAFM